MKAQDTLAKTKNTLFHVITIFFYSSFFLIEAFNFIPVVEISVSNSSLNSFFSYSPSNMKLKPEIKP